MDLALQVYGDQVRAGQLMDLGKLEAALGAPFIAFQGFEPYPTLAEKAVKLLEGLSRAQAFSDGNKRLAWLLMTTFLEVNGLRVVGLGEAEAAGFVLDIDGSPNGLAAAALWLNGYLATVI